MHATASRWLLPALLLAFILPLYIGLVPWAFDDAFIHLRVAGNLAAGEGPYYNPGQVVNASSAPAWTLLLALMKMLGGSVIWIACLNAVLTVAGARVFVDLVERLGGAAPDPSAGSSLARFLADLDSDGNATDFEVLTMPTPGVAEFSTVPEPGTALLMFVGLVTLTLLGRRRPVAGPGSGNR